MILLLLGCVRAPCGPGGDFADPPASHADDAFLFSWDRISRLELELDDDAVEILDVERLLTRPHRRVPTRLVVDGERVGTVGARLRGGFGSFERFAAKPEWDLDLDEYEDLRLAGLKALSLDNARADASHLREAGGHAVYAAAGVPSSRTGYAQLFVNGEDKGLYDLVESQDDEWLERVFGSSDGNLYDASYARVGQALVFLDFAAGRDELFDLEEGVDVGHRDVAAISELVDASLDAGRILPELARAVDWDAVRRLMIADQWLGNDDGYVAHRNNYKPWFPGDGPMALGAWDMDGAFRLDADDDVWREPKGALAELCLADADCRGAFRALLPEVTAAIDAAGIGERLRAAADRTEAAARRDPWGTCDAEALRSDRDDVLGWFDRATERLLAAW